MSKNISRIEYIDLVKGIGILLMIMGHVGFGELYDRYCNAFHMPLFFFVSGWLYTDNTLLKKLLKKTATLIIPYISYCFLALAILFVTTGNRINFEDFMIKVLFPQKSIPYVGSIWFLVALFTCEILYTLLNYALNTYAKVSIAVLLIVILGHIEGIFGHFLPFEIGAAFIGIGFYHVARGIRKYKKHIPILDNWGGRIIAFALLVVSTYLQKDRISMSGGLYGIIPLFWFNAFGWIGIVWGVSEAVCRRRLDDRFLEIFIRPLKSMGRNSISFVALNTLILEIARLIFSFISIKIFRRFVELFVVVVVVMLLDMIIRRSILRNFLIKYPIEL